MKTGGIGFAGNSFMDAYMKSQQAQQQAQLRDLYYKYLQQKMGQESDQFAHDKQGWNPAIGNVTPAPGSAGGPKVGGRIDPNAPPPPNSGGTSTPTYKPGVQPGAFPGGGGPGGFQQAAFVPGAQGMQPPPQQGPGAFGPLPNFNPQMFQQPSLTMPGMNMPGGSPQGFPGLPMPGQQNQQQGGQQGLNSLLEFLKKRFDTTQGMQMSGDPANGFGYGGGAFAPGGGVGWGSGGMT